MERPAGVQTKLKNNSMTPTTTRPAFIVYYSFGVDLFGVLDVDGFDALGEGFETQEEAQAEADKLNAQ